MPPSSEAEAALAAASIPERLTRPLRAALEGEHPANVGLMHLLIEALDPGEVETTLDAARRALDPASPAAAARLEAMQTMWRANPGAWETVKGVLAQVTHDHGAPADTGAALARTAAEFDAAARLAPDAGSALYALGSPEILADATAEIVGRLRAWDLLGPQRIALDLGCGNGRVTAALAPEMGGIFGLDISREMLRAAGRRCGGLANAVFVQMSGRDIACLADGALDLVLAVDSFPYLVQSGGDLAARHVAEAARVLRPGGDLVILNYSYRGDPGLDRADLQSLAAAHGFDVLRDGERPFTLWDGLAFDLRMR